jgi:hypothetical protein
MENLAAMSIEASEVKLERTIYIYANAISHLGWWSPNKKWLTKMSPIYDFDRPFQIVNIFCYKMADKNREMTDILVSHFLVGDHNLADE